MGLSELHSKMSKHLNKIKMGQRSRSGEMEMECAVFEPCAKILIPSKKQRMLQKYLSNTFLH